MCLMGAGSADCCAGRTTTWIAEWLPFMWSSMPSRAARLACRVSYLTRATCLCVPSKRSNLPSRSKSPSTLYDK